MAREKQLWIGFGEIIASGIAFGFLGFFGKRAFAAGIRPGELLCLRFLVSAAILGAVLLAWAPGRLRLSRAEAAKCAILGVAGYAVFSSCFFYALQSLSASLTVLLLYLYPVFVTLGAWIFLGERIGAHVWVALPMAFLGLVGLVWGEWRVSAASGLWLGLGSAIFYSLYILASRAWLKGVSPLASTFAIQVSAGLCLAFVHFSGWERPWRILSTSGLLLAGVAVISTLAAMSLFLSGLRKVSSAQASVLSMSEPLTGVIVAVAFLGERVTIFQALGGAFVLGSLILISREKRA